MQTQRDEGERECEREREHEQTNERSSCEGIDTDDKERFLRVNVTMSSMKIKETVTYMFDDE